ncbi:MAG TPA: hypothetical protein VK841_17530 [Polyangiaceae bacterium]|nr:hypothetical protein [Polyangiaceae bacterium]
MVRGIPDGGTAESNPATISSVRIDKYDVTVGRFRQFVSAWNGGYTPPVGSGIHTHLNSGLGLVNSGAPSSDAGAAYETGWSTAWNSAIAPTNSNLACAPPYDT